MAPPSIDSIKTLILRCYRDVSPKDLQGLRRVHGGYITVDRKWIYTLQLGGFIERTKVAEEVIPVPLLQPISGGPIWMGISPKT